MTNVIIASALCANWSVPAERIEHLAVGQGGYHWRASTRGSEQYFLTISDLSDGDIGQAQTFARLRAAFESALLLRQSGLEFVVAPIPTTDGALLVRLDRRWAAGLFWMIDGLAGAFGPTKASERAEVLEVLTALHRSPLARSLAVPRPAPEIAGRNALEGLLGGATVWPSGPLAREAGRALEAHRRIVRALLDGFDRARMLILEAPVESLVVTHGEPHPANLVRSVAGLRLVDWDTVAVAPPERDLWMVLAGDARAADAYSEMTRHQVSWPLIRLYRSMWRLRNIAAYSRIVSRELRPSSDTEAALERLLHYLESDATPFDPICT